MSEEFPMTQEAARQTSGVDQLVESGVITSSQRETIEKEVAARVPDAAAQVGMYHFMVQYIEIRSIAHNDDEALQAFRLQIDMQPVAAIGAVMAKAEKIGGKSASRSVMSTILQANNTVILNAAYGESTAIEDIKTRSGNNIYKTAIGEFESFHSRYNAIYANSLSTILSPDITIDKMSFLKLLEKLRRLLADLTAAIEAGQLALARALQAQIDILKGKFSSGNNLDQATIGTLATAAVPA